MPKNGPSTRKPTIYDVAALAGVGRSTVSRVLNDEPNVRDSVRKKVMQAVELLGYKVNLQARYLAGGGGRQIVLVHESDFDTEPNSYYHAGLELGALRACSEKGFQLTTHTVSPSPDTYRGVLLGLIRAGRCNGLILTPPLSDDLTLIEEVTELGCPLVCVSAGKVARAQVTSVGVDDEQSGYELAKYLLRLGHRTFAYIRGPKDHLSADERFNGFSRALDEAHLSMDEDLVLRGDFTFRSGIELAQMIFERPSRPSVLVCANDDMAAGVLLTAHKMGVNVPSEISVTGFDDTPMSEIVWPPLTTVHQPIRDIGYMAVNMLVEQMKPTGPVELPHFTVIPHRIVERDSAAAC